MSASIIYKCRNNYLYVKTRTFHERLTMARCTLFLLRFLAMEYFLYSSHHLYFFSPRLWILIRLFIFFARRNIKYLLMIRNRGFGNVRIKSMREVYFRMMYSFWRYYCRYWKRCGYKMIHFLIIKYYEVEVRSKNDNVNIDSNFPA